MLKYPAPLVLADSCTPVAVLVACTVAAGTAAPDGSVTSPMIEPETDCPRSDGVNETVRARMLSKSRTRFFIRTPPKWFKGNQPGQQLQVFSEVSANRDTNPGARPLSRQKC